MKAKPKCEELQRLRDEAKAAVLRVSRINRFGHLADAEAREEGRRKIDAMIQHLLVGHSGRPCPAGDRPIVKPREEELSGSEPVFDIFKGATTKDALWIEAVTGLSNARERMEKIAKKAPGQYFVFSSENHSIVARIDSRKAAPVLRERKSEAL